MPTTTSMKKTKNDLKNDMVAGLEDMKKSQVEMKGSIIVAKSGMAANMTAGQGEIKKSRRKIKKSINAVTVVKKM